MNRSIRKLYNVLVVGGALAAGATGCSKSPAKPSTPAPVDAPAATTATKPATEDAPAAPAPAPVVAPEATGVTGWSG